MILAAVSINAAFNTGIIDTAVNGAVNYAEAQRQEQVTFDELDGNLQDIIQRIEEYDIGGGNKPNPTPIQDPTPKLEAPKQDGSYDVARKVNTPKVAGTGLIPVYYNGTSWVDLTSSSTKAEWNSWFNYDTQNWANARTADGSMWVWIPRYEYQINDSNKTIAVNFIEGTGTSTTSGYTLHPAFSTDINNGGWDSNISGFWVAKYPAGWQNGQGTSLGSSVDMSNITYKTSATSGTYAGTISNNSTKMSYPVFKANTYAYNYISVGDAYALSQDIKNAARYGLNSTVDSHLQKNSEWGAVAYLTHSKYGLDANSENKKAVTQNTRNNSNSPTGILGVTSLETTTNTSTTQNVTGVYDMSGCVWELTASFLSGASQTSYITGMPTESSSKYVTLYTESTGKPGDATIETFRWNDHYVTYTSGEKPVYVRGSGYDRAHQYSDIFSFGENDGNAHYDLGFRAVLMPN